MTACGAWNSVPWRHSLKTALRIAMDSTAWLLFQSSKVEHACAIRLQYLSARLASRR